mmetsp:Transcript_6889/g.17747  ORF Transcript_6889/g.17747 Transcript_6889/m.17747 type:complete len:138 (+) Transcript_6889:345-758(+)
MAGLTPDTSSHSPRELRLWRPAPSTAVAAGSCCTEFPQEPDTPRGIAAPRLPTTRDQARVPVSRRPGFALIARAAPDLEVAMAARTTVPFLDVTQLLWQCVGWHPSRCPGSTQTTQCEGEIETRGWSVRDGWRTELS